MKLYIIDAFAEEIFGGNPAGVVILSEMEDFPPTEVMIRTAAELRYSETVFIQKKEDRQFVARYFTPRDEVDLCGHATIAAFGAFFEEKAVVEGQHYYLKTKAGNLQINIRNQRIFMEMGTPEDLGELEALDELVQILGIPMEELGSKPRIVSTGLPDVMVEVKDRAGLLAMKPDFPAMARMSERLGVVGIHAFALGEEKDITAYCRNFAPLYAIDEEAATGTANGALTYLLYQRGILQEGAENLFLQGESMGRPSKIFSVLEKKDSVKIRVGGSYKVLVRGEIFL